MGLSEIANARKRMIEGLERSDPLTYARFLHDLDSAERVSHFLRNSGRFPLCGRGDINTYTVFAESALTLHNPQGRAGVIVPSGIATDDTTKFYFQAISDEQRL